MTMRNVHPWLLPALMIISAAAMRSISYLHDDVSWLITMAEQVLAGKKAYVDLIDVNPPASFLIYIPQVAIASILGITSEFAVTVSVFVGTLASTAMAGFVLVNARAIEKSRSPYFVALALAILLVLCGDIFAQREHFALVSLLPLLSCYIARSVGHTPDRAVLILAGLGGSVALALKPYFIFPIGLPLLYVVWTNRQSFSNVARTLFALENLTLAMSQIVYLAAVYAAFPTYFKSIVPVAIDIYLPIRLTMWALLKHASTWAICGSAALALAASFRRTVGPIFWVCVYSATGFAAAYVIQAKGWPYHAYPAVALFLFAAGDVFIDKIFPELLRKAPRQRVALIAATCALLALFTALDLRWAKLPLLHPPIYSALKSIAPPHATVIGISADDLSSPQVTRLIGGTWVGRVPYQFMWRYATQVMHTQRGLAPETVKRLSGYVEFDQAILVDQIRTQKPDIILITAANFKDWVLDQPKIAGALTGYRQASVVNGMAIWVRQ
jgi:hypothetical protein